MSDLIGDPNQTWNSAYWTCTGLGQPASQFPISQDPCPSVPTLPVDGNFQQHPPLVVSSVTSCQFDTRDNRQLLGANFQQSQWNLASWDQSNQDTMPFIQQGQLNLPQSTHGGATFVAPQLSMTDAMSNDLLPEQQSQSTPTQFLHTSATSSPSSAFDFKSPEVTRSVSPNPDALTVYGFKDLDNSWSCAWPGCTSRTRFTRACDLRKHFKRHSKTLFCRYSGCPQSREAGFSSKKDRARHETKHNPTIICEWENCGRLFGRVDNMKDHARRVHGRCAATRLTSHIVYAN